jgi:hypothetical protein
MVRKNWIMIVCCAALVAMVCTVSYAEKCEKGEKKCSLPAAIEAAVKALFPKGVISESKQDEEEIKAYKVEVKDSNNETDVKLAEDGTVIEVESEATIDTVPAAVAAAIKAEKAEVKEVSKEVQYAKVQIVKLDTPITTYSADIVKDGKKIELEIAADGKILEQEVKKDKKDKDKDDDKDDHKDKD